MAFLKRVRGSFLDATHLVAPLGLFLASVLSLISIEERSRRPLLLRRLLFPILLGERQYRRSSSRGVVAREARR